MFFQPDSPVVGGADCHEEEDPSLGICSTGDAAAAESRVEAAPRARG